MSPKSANRLKHRLPSEIVPIRYDIQMKPEFDLKKFSGSVNIRFELLAPITYLPVHVNTLNAITDRVSLLHPNGDIKSDISKFNTYPYPQFDYFVTEFLKPLRIGTYQIRYRFQGFLDNQQVGMFLMKYFNSESGNYHFIATSKFQPIFARTAFPCFDEPHLKAKFAITILHDVDHHCNALSNMNVDNTGIRGCKVETQFACSPPMSTCMTCFFVSNFVWESRRVKSSLPASRDFELCFHTQPSEIKNIVVALDVAFELVQYLIKYFDVAYPLPKLDMVAIPEYTAVAMEHWGLIMFNAKIVLYNRENNTCADKQRLITLLANQIAHMWIGNLVTGKWWSDLWLTEGLVNYLEYKIVNELYPDLGIMDQFLLLELYPVMEEDGRLSASCLERKIGNTRQIYDVFDKISYSKSAALIRLFDSFMEKDELQKTLQTYLKKSAFKTADSQSFFNILEDHKQFSSLRQMLDSYLTQTGFPLLTVVQIKDNTYELTQRSFRSKWDQNVDKMSKVDPTWTIPVTYFSSADSKVTSVFFHRSENDLVVVLPKSSPVEWIKFNKDHMGYYRVNYSTALWHRLSRALFKNPSQFSISDRAELLSDAFTMGNVGLISYEIPLEMTSYLGREFEFVPWYVVLGYFKDIKEFLRGITLQDDLMSYVRHLLVRLYSLVTWDEELTHTQSLLRISIIEAACEFELPEALSEVKRRFRLWIRNPSLKINPDVRSIVYYYGMQEIGTPEIWQKIWDHFMTEKNAQEKQKILRCLAAIKNQEVLKILIDMIWEDQNSQGETFLRCLYFISCNPVGRDIAWNYVRSHWFHLIDYFGDSNASLSRLIPNITEYFKTTLELEEMRYFLNEHPRGGISNSDRKKATLNISLNIVWLDQHLPEISAYFTKQKASDSFHSCTEFMYEVT